MKSFVVFIWLLVIVLSTSWFFFWPGMFYLHDYLHTARIAEVARALQDGHFPVRWSENFGYGYGMPLFEFYAPVPYYVGSLFVLIGIPSLVATKLLFIICNMFTVWGSYLMGRSWYGRVGGLLTAAAVSLAPYRAVNLYVRGALSEAWGIMAIAWIVYFILQTIKGMKYAWVGLTISLVVLFLSHNLLTLLFIPFSLTIALICLLYQANNNNTTVLFTMKSAAIILSSYILAIGIAAFYIFPAFLEKNYTKVAEVVVGGYFDYALHFVYLRQFFQPTWGYGGSNWGPEDGISFFLGYGQLLALFLSLAALAVTAKKMLINSPRQISRPLWLWSAAVGVLLIGSLLLATEKSIIIWRSLSLLQFVQFPWRFLSISLILIGLLAPVFLYTQRSFVTRWIVGWLVLLTFFANLVFFKPQSFIEEPSTYYAGDEYSIQTRLSDVLPDYLPVTANKPAEPPAVVASCIDNCQVLEVTTDKFQEKTVIVQTPIATSLTFSIHYFHGWTVEVNNSAVEVFESNGLVTATIPEGQSTVTAKFGSTPTRRSSDMVSIVSMVVFGAVIGIQRGKKV